MATWHELIESMKRSGKADPLYVKQVPLSIVKRDLVSVKRGLTHKGDRPGCTMS